MLVPDVIRECACFVFVCVGGEMRPVGTAFFVSVPFGATGKYGPVLVTAMHVLVQARTLDDGDGYVYVRVNTTDGEAEFVRIDDEMWATPEQAPLAVDVAACVWGGDRDHYEYKTVSVATWLTDEISEVENVGVGDDLFLTGLFVNHLGKQRNIPIVRVGNIAAMPDEPVATKLGPMKAYLIEARSVGGLSGSPVFLNLGTHRLKKDDGNARMRAGQIWNLLGVMHGHWQAPSTDVGAVVDDGLSDEYVNMGIAIVTPISKVAELLTDPKLKVPIDAATKVAEAKEAENLPTMDSTKPSAA